ncbi:MAG: protein translocase subunit SecF [Armatimonadetes bacterium]|nr:protein translocase subunit SecF [Armatimonadota bacterium]
MDFFRRQNWDLVGRSYVWFTLSGVLLVAGIAVWATMGLNLGIDFTGGGLIRYEFEKPIATTRDAQIQVLEQVRNALGPVGLGHSQVLIGGNNQIIVRTPPVQNDEEAMRQDDAIRAELEKLYGAQYGPIRDLGRETVGPVVGGQLRASAMHALLLGLVLILIYITIRYEFRFAVAAIIALAHDVLMLTGFMALLRLELDSSFVAVVLTVVGFSVHDTIIIFDRIRENTRLHRRANFADTVNASLLQTLGRSIYTVLTTLFTLTALAIFATDSIRVFAIAMIIGIILGAYSSIFNASQIVVVWERYAARRRAAASPTARRRERVRTTATTAVEAAEEDYEAEDQESEEPAAKPRRLSAQEAMERAEKQAQDEKRQQRRERRQQQKARAKAGSKSKRRF